MEWNMFIWFFVQKLVDATFTYNFSALYISFLKKKLFNTTFSFLLTLPWQMLQLAIHFIVALLFLSVPVIFPWKKKSFKFSIICRKNFSEISSMCIGRRALTQLFLTLNQFKGYVPFIHLPSNLPTQPRLPENSRKPNIFWCFQEL